MSAYVYLVAISLVLANAAKQHTKDRFIESLQREPAMGRSVGQLIHQRERALQIDRGISR